MFETKLIKPDYRLAEREAIRLLNESGVYQPPVNPVEIAHDIGVRVSFVHFSGESEGVAGLYDPSEDQILVNADEAGVRQTFTVAHELGHRIMHAEWAKSEAYKVLWRDPKRQSKDRRETEANVFAANLLMPKQMVDEYKSLPVSSIARIFAVSEQVATFRLQNLYGI
ncbi:ImmA/IrrE family metallo-endopeptidase [Edaphobacter dinghuensis]|nr:ImmA/IrrE family metallo-endopeptidase [Edaphobacter dinghuensis]